MSKVGMGRLESAMAFQICREGAWPSKSLSLHQSKRLNGSRTCVNTGGALVPLRAALPCSVPPPGLALIAPPPVLRFSCPLNGCAACWAVPQREHCPLEAQHRRGPPPEAASAGGSSRVRSATPGLPPAPQRLPLPYFRTDLRGHRALVLRQEYLHLLGNTDW